MKKTIKTLLSLIIIAFMFFGIMQSNNILANAKTDETEALTATAKLSKTVFTYNRKEQKPKVKVKNAKGKTLKEGTHYKVKYPKEPIKVGTYNVTVTYKGDYSGKETLSYEIVPRAVKELTFEQGTELYKDKIDPMYSYYQYIDENYAYYQREINGVKLLWKKANGVTGYRIYIYKNNKWKKFADIDQHEYTIRDLTPGKVYKFAVKSFKTIGDKKYFSNTYSTINVASRPEKTPLNVKLKGNKIYITWDKKSCSGYYLYILDGPWEKEKKINIKDNNTTTYIYEYPKYSYYVRFEIKTYASTDKGKVLSERNYKYVEMEPTASKTDDGIKIKPVQSKEGLAILDKWYNYRIDYTGKNLHYSVKRYFEGMSANGKHVVVYSHSSDGWSGIDLRGVYYYGNGKAERCPGCNKLAAQNDGKNMCDAIGCYIFFGYSGESA